MSVELRPLKGKDMFRMSKIVRKMGLLDMDIKTEGKTEKEIGLEVVKKIVENMDKAEAEINEFLGDLVGMTPAQFADQDLAVIIDTLKSMATMPGISDFFQHAKALSQ